MATAADPTYDLQSALAILAPGVVIQRQLLDAAAAHYAANGFTPITSGQVVAILAAANTLDTTGAAYAPTVNGTYATALPTYPASLKRFTDSNPTSLDDWAIDNERGIF